jgi:hypothetical protein
MSDDPTPVPAGQEPLLVCDRCGPTTGTVWEDRTGTLCIACMFPDAVCSVCAAGGPLSDWEGHWYCESCYRVIVARAIGRLETFKLLGKKPSRGQIPVILDGRTKLPERRPGSGGRKAKYTPEARQDYITRARDYLARGYGLRAISKTLGPSRSQFSRWLRGNFDEF